MDNLHRDREVIERARERVSDNPLHPNISMHILPTVSLHIS